MSHQPGLQSNNGGDDGSDILSTRVLERLDVPILQAIVSTEPRAAWLEREIGLSRLTSR